MLWRFVQAFGGSVVPTVVQAMVRDLYDRNQSARILSLNMLVTASAPVVAPLIGGQVLLWLDWRAIFWVLVGFGLVSLLAASALPETLGTSRRNEVHPLAMVLGYFEFLRSVRYVGYVRRLRAWTRSGWCGRMATSVSRPGVTMPQQQKVILRILRPEASGGPFDQQD